MHIASIDRDYFFYQNVMTPVMSEFLERFCDITGSHQCIHVNSVNEIANFISEFDAIIVDHNQDTPELQAERKILIGYRNWGKQKPSMISKDDIFKLFFQKVAENLN